MITDIDHPGNWRGSALRWAGAFCLVLGLHVGVVFAMLDRPHQVSAPAAPPALIMVDLPIDAILPTADSVESIASQEVAEVAASETAEPVGPDEIVEEIVEEVLAQQQTEVSMEVERPIEPVEIITARPVIEIPMEAAVTEPPQELLEEIRPDEPVESTPPIETVTAESNAELKPTEGTETRDFARLLEHRSEEPLTEAELETTTVVERSPEVPTEIVDSVRPAEITGREIALAEPVLPTQAVTAEPVVDPPMPRKKPPVAAQAASKGSINSQPSSGAGRSNPQELARYLSEVRATILKNRGSVRSDASGQVVIRAVIDTSGQLSGIRVVRSSGRPILDEAALEVVRRVGRVPVIPQDLGRTSIPLNIPFRFSGG